MGAAISGVSLFALAMIIAAVPIIKLIGWMIDGAVDTGLAAGSLAMYLVLVALCVSGPSVIKVLALILLLIAALAAPLISKVAADRESDKIESGRKAAVTEALERNPMDPVARIAVAEHLYREGRLEEAIEQIEWVVNQFPKLRARHGYQLESWRRELARGGKPGIMVCHICYAEQPVDARYCSECGIAFDTREGMLQGIWRDGGPVVILRGYLTIGLTLMVVAMVFLELPALIAGPLAIGAIIVAATLFLRWVGGGIGKPAD